MLALLFHGNDLNRDVPRERVLFQMAQHRPPEHVRQEDVQGDGCRLELPCHGQREIAAHRHHAFEAFVPRQPKQHARVMWIILDDQ